ncbi:MAG: hypothetical protein KKB29_02135, partial [Nanoarchaeota archaeon]|nr:hypothetical protein [Nanoarchaeota archaeon]
RQVSALVEVIKGDFGIELKGHGVRKLAYYVSCFGDKADKERSSEKNYASFVPQIDALLIFMKDVFGFNYRELGGKEYVGKYRGHILNARGMNLLRTEPFKEYCRRHIDEWRAEEEMI